MLFIEEVEVLAGTSVYNHRPFSVELQKGKRTRPVWLKMKMYVSMSVFACAGEALLQPIPHVRRFYSR